MMSHVIFWWITSRLSSDQPVRDANGISQISYPFIIGGGGGWNDSPVDAHAICRPCRFDSNGIWSRGSPLLGWRGEFCPIFPLYLARWAVDNRQRNSYKEEKFALKIRGKKGSDLVILVKCHMGCWTNFHRGGKILLCSAISQMLS